MPHFVNCSTYDSAILCFFEEGRKFRFSGGFHDIAYNDDQHVKFFFKSGFIGGCIGWILGCIYEV